MSGGYRKLPSARTSHQENYLKLKYYRMSKASMRVKNSVELELMGYQTVINAGFEVFYGSYLQIDASWRCGGALWTYLSRLFP